MRRSLALLTLSVAFVGCSAANLTEVSADCSRIMGSVWRSVDELAAGETVDHWEVEFGEGYARWRRSDGPIDTRYRCDDGVLTAGDSEWSIDPSMLADGDRVRLRWHGNLYRRIDSFYDIP